MMKATNMGGSSCFSFGGHGNTRPVPHEREDDFRLAQELNALTIEQRNQLYEEVRGSTDDWKCVLGSVHLTDFDSLLGYRSMV